MTIKSEDLKPPVRELREEIEHMLQDMPRQDVRSILRRAHEALGECSRLSCAYCVHQGRLEAGQEQPDDSVSVPEPVAEPVKEG